MISLLLYMVIVTLFITLTQGDQAALHNLIKSGEVDTTSLRQYSVDKLRDICKKCKIVYSGKSQVLSLFLLVKSIQIIHVDIELWCHICR